MDELGAPFGVTVDFQTVEDKSVTLRERDSMTQIRMPLVDVAPLVARLVTEEATWGVRREAHPPWHFLGKNFRATNVPIRCSPCVLQPAPFCRRWRLLSVSLRLPAVDGCDADADVPRKRSGWIGTRLSVCAHVVSFARKRCSRVRASSALCTRVY